jgi:hypothetical protein
MKKWINDYLPTVLIVGLIVGSSAHAWYFNGW